MINKRNALLSELKELSREKEDLLIGLIEYKDVEYPEMDEEEYIVLLTSLISEIENFSLKTAREGAISNFESLKEVNVDAIDNKFHKDCRAIMEIEEKELFHKSTIIKMESLQEKLINYTARK